MAHLRPLLLVALALLIGVSQSGCASKRSQEVSTNLWKTWESMEQLLQADYPDAPPLILIHGWNGGEFTWPSPDELRKLETMLQRDVFFFTYRTGLFANRYPPLEIMEEELDRFMAKYPNVDVVAHSMGGLLLRQYLSHHPDHPVHQVVFLATPHFGTSAAKVLTSLASIGAEGNIQAQEIQPGSDFLWQLNDLHGAELEGVGVLNVYVGESGWLDGDLVVEPSSAYLPWAHNMEVQGDHHTLAHRLLQFQFIIDFLRDGTLPPVEAGVPARRDVWLHFVPREGGEPMAVPQPSMRRLSAKGFPEQGGFTICCDSRASLYPLGGNTVVAEDVKPGMIYEFIPRNGHEPVRISMDDILRVDRPVQLRNIIVEPPKSDRWSLHPSESAPDKPLPEEAPASPGTQSSVASPAEQGM